MPVGVGTNELGVAEEPVSPIYAAGVGGQQYLGMRPGDALTGFDSPSSSLSPRSDGLLDADFFGDGVG